MGIFDGFLGKKLMDGAVSKMLPNVNEAEKRDFLKNPNHFLEKPENEMKLNNAINKMLASIEAKVEIFDDGVGIKGDFSKIPKVGGLASMMVGSGRKAIFLPNELSPKFINDIKILPNSIKQWASEHPKSSQMVYNKILTLIKKKAK